MKIELTLQEARVLGCLMEKEATTPENYPLSINALTNACNQKSNRDPVLNLGETEVQQVVDALVKKHLVSDRSGYGGRVTKYKHVFCNTEFGPLKFTDIERAIICELLVRGPQSAGELRTRCNRMTPHCRRGRGGGGAAGASAHTPAAPSSSGCRALPARGMRAMRIC